MNFKQENGKYLARWKLDNQDQKLQHGLIYGLSWDIKGRAKKILDKEL